MASEWNYEKNGNVKPTYVTCHSGKKVWWKCEKGHEWQASISHRMNGRNCPVCCGKKILIGYNDLLSQRPDIAKEWDYEKNGNIKPTDVTCHSAKKVWWHCKCGHSWEARISHRTDRHSNCPYCSSNQVLAGFNDFQTKYPEIAKEWNYEKNGNLLPQEVSSKNTQKVWWIGSCGHEWQARVVTRTNKHAGCPYCSGKQVLRGFNDLATRFPEIL